MAGATKTQQGVTRILVILILDAVLVGGGIAFVIAHDITDASEEILTAADRLDRDSVINVRALEIVPP